MFFHCLYCVLCVSGQVWFLQNISLVLRARVQRTPQPIICIIGRARLCEKQFYMASDILRKYESTKSLNYNFVRDDMGNPPSDCPKQLLPNFR